MSNTVLRSMAERIARLEEDRKAIADEIKEIKVEAKGQGYDVALLTKTVRIMLMETAKRKKALEQHDLFDSYLSAVGLLAGNEAGPEPARETAKPEVSAALIETVAAGLQTEIGRKALVTAIDIMIEREEAVDPETGEIIETNPPETASPMDRDGRPQRDAAPSVPAESNTVGAGQPGSEASHAEPGASPGGLSFANISIPDDQLVSVRYPEGVRKVPYSEFKRGVAAASGAA